VYPLFARYSVREIFSGRRAEIQQEITKELRPRLAARGILLRGVDMGQVDLPPDYRGSATRGLARALGFPPERRHLGDRCAFTR
jgi:regulator of protease activity HflC (stomatin/prohibitin superfamily)